MMIPLKLLSPLNFLLGFLVQGGAEQDTTCQPTHGCMLAGQPREAGEQRNSLLASIILSSNQAQSGRFTHSECIIY